MYRHINSGQEITDGEFRALPASEKTDFQHVINEDDETTSGDEEEEDDDFLDVAADIVSDILAPDLDFGGTDIPDAPSTDFGGGGGYDGGGADSDF